MIRKLLRLLGIRSLDEQLTEAYADGRADERAEWMLMMPAATALVAMCEVHGDFRNGVTDPTGATDEGEAIASGIIQAARADIEERAAS